MEQNITWSYVVRDPTLQVRERLDETWIAELADLYRGQHQIAAVEAVYDGERYLLTDGWHRHEAQLIAWGHDAVIAVEVIDASKADDPMSVAKTRAAMANRQGGLRRTEGDKKRAVTLLRSTPAGRKMTHDEIAKRVGVSRSWATRILDGAETDVRTNMSSACSNLTEGPPQTSTRALWAQVDAALRADAGKPDKYIAAEIGCNDRVVRGRRSALGLPKSDTSRRHDSPRDGIAEELRKDPDRPNVAIARSIGSTAPTVAKVRADLGLLPRPRGGPRGQSPPSAPINPKRDDDPREQNVEVLPARPPISNGRELEMVRAFERASMEERRGALVTIFKRWPELGEDRPEPESLVLQ